MKKLFSKLVFKILGWKIVGSIPEIKKCVVISAPHTSNWDFLIGRCFAYILDIKPKYLVKRELYIWPLSILIKLNGGIPVYRKTAKNTVDQVVEKFQTTENLILGIAPEGTRTRVEKWKTGFIILHKKPMFLSCLCIWITKKKKLAILTC